MVIPFPIRANVVMRSGHLIGLGMCAITFFVGRFVQNPSCSSCSPWQCDPELFFVRKPNSSGGLSYIPAHTATAERGKKGHLGPFQGPWEVGQQPHEVESEQRPAYKVVVLGQEVDLDKHNQVRNAIQTEITAFIC